ncbi:MAG: FMN-binding protein, partial [Acidimicrobiales bacterium]
GGLATAFSFTDSPTSSQVMASGGIVSAAGATPVANGGVATTQPTVVNGDVFTNRFGPVQVQATFNADGSIASVNTIQTPDGDGKSIRINDRAVPTLNSEALAAQTARVDTVSGATYTSRGYEQSLQSAIDAARAAGITQVA